MSALPPEADMLIVGINVRYVPIAEFARLLGPELTQRSRRSPGRRIWVKRRYQNESLILDASYCCLLNEKRKSGMTRHASYDVGNTACRGRCRLRLFKQRRHAQALYEVWH